MNLEHPTSFSCTCHESAAICRQSKSMLLTDFATKEAVHEGERRILMRIGVEDPDNERLTVGPFEGARCLIPGACYAAKWRL